MEQFNILPSNGVVVIKAEENKCLLQVYDQSVSIGLKRKKKLGDLKEVLIELKGKRNCIINSDIYDVVNEKIKVRNLEKHNLVRILKKVMEDSYTYITKISEEENQDVLIHITIAEDNPALTVTAGLERDIQVLLFDIHYERHERSIKC